MAVALPASAFINTERRHDDNVFSVFERSLWGSFPRIPPASVAECGAPELAGAVQGPVGRDAQAVALLPQEDAAQNQEGVRTRAGEVPSDEAR